MQGEQQFPGLLRSSLLRTSHLIFIQRSSYANGICLDSCRAEREVWFHARSSDGLVCRYRSFSSDRRDREFCRPDRHFGGGCQLDGCSQQSADFGCREHHGGRYFFHVDLGERRTDDLVVSYRHLCLEYRSDVDGLVYVIDSGPGFLSFWLNGFRPRYYDQIDGQDLQAQASQQRGSCCSKTHTGSEDGSHGRERSSERRPARQAEVVGGRTGYHGQKQARLEFK